MTSLLVSVGYARQVKVFGVRGQNLREHFLKKKNKQNSKEASCPFASLPT